MQPLPRSGSSGVDTDIRHDATPGYQETFMDTGYASRMIDRYLNKTLVVLAVVFVAAIVVLGVGERPPRIAQLPLSGEVAGR